MNKVFEKIIEKLEEEKMSYFLTIANTGDEKLDCAYEQVGDALDKAIEIVKQGGVSDDVCECRLLKGYNFLHKTSCGDVFDMENGFKFCPYCGKKIKGCGVNMKTKIQKSLKLKQYYNFCRFLGCIEEYDEIIEKLEDELKKRKENEAE